MLQDVFSLTDLPPIAAFERGRRKKDSLGSVSTLDLNLKPRL